MKRKSICFLLALLFAIAAFSGCSDPIILRPTEGDGTDTDGASVKAGVKIVPSETAQIRFESYDNGLVSMEIPRGWKVEIPPTDYIHYSFKAYDPKNPDRRLLFNLKLEGFLKSVAARNWDQRTYPDSVFARLPALDPQNTDSFYAVWNETANCANEYDLNGYIYFPQLQEFTVIEDLGVHPLGGNVLRGSFKNGAGEPQQGLFTASVVSSGSYWASGMDMAPLNVYHAVQMCAPDGEFTDWQPILDHTLSTLQFSQAFVQGFMNQEATLVSVIQANQKIYDSISDSIMDSWNKRNASYDIISQKQSDATLGYERVYDTETGDVYRAYNGFTDDYKGERYQAVPDSMYTSPISGYIEK